MVIILISEIAIFCTSYFGSERWYIEQKIAKMQLDQHSEYNTIEKPHFIVKFLESDKMQAYIIAAYAEIIYEPVTTIFQLQPPEKTLIVITSSPPVKLEKERFIPGYTDRGIIHIDNNCDSYAPVISIVAHEFSHVMIRHKYNGAYKLSPWIDEGMAYNVETSITGAKKKNTDFWDKEELYTIEALEKLPPFVGIKNPDPIYPQCSGIISYISETYGKNIFFEILAKINYEHKSFAEAVQATLHIDIPTLSNDSQLYFKKHSEIHGAFKSTFASEF